MPGRTALKQPFFRGRRKGCFFKRGGTVSLPVAAIAGKGLEKLDILYFDDNIDL
jgi:hypothetical protein